MIRAAVLFLALAALVFLMPGAARAAEPKVDDKGGFFSKEAIDKATQTLHDIDRRYRIEVVVETFPSIPEEMKDKYKPEEKAKFFQRWAESRAADQGVKGIYLLACKDPAYLYMEPDEAVRKKAFPLADRNAVVKKTTARMREKKYDAALTETLDSIETTLAANGAPHTKP